VVSAATSIFGGEAPEPPGLSDDTNRDNTSGRYKTVPDTARETSFASSTREPEGAT
jgi:hypothetical protein